MRDGELIAALAALPDDRRAAILNHFGFQRRRVVRDDLGMKPGVRNAAKALIEGKPTYVNKEVRAAAELLRGLALKSERKSDFE